MRLSPRGHRRRLDSELKQADESLAAARRARTEQETKRDTEKRTVIADMDRLAEQNHLGALVWNVITDQNGNGS